MRSRAWLLVGLLAPVGALLPADATAAADPLASAIAWLASQQGATSFGYAAPAYVVEAVAQAGLDPKTWPSPERNVFSMMQPLANGPALGVYQSKARIAHAVGTSGYDARDVAGHDYVADVRAGYVGSQADVLDDAWLILALRATGAPADDEHVQRAALLLEAARGSSGGWGITATAKSGTDTTGMVVVALAAAGRDVATDTRARAFLDSTRGPAGGHTEPANAFPENCQSTVWALHAYDAMGVAPDPRTLSFFAGLQDEDGRIRRHPGTRDTPSDAWCTAEAIVYLAGARHPLPGFAPGAMVLPRPHALDATSLRVEGPFQRATWETGGARLVGKVATHAFATSGAEPVSLLAEGDGTRWRATGVIEVLSARPRMALGVSEVETLRHEAVALPFAASDPDGSLAALEFDWGDGVSGATAEHAYALPGAYDVRARARDDAGYWSDAARATVRVLNRDPVLSPLPPRIVADRVAPLALDLAAADADGDTVALTWILADQSGAGDVDATLTALGEHALEVVARDPYGGESRAHVAVEVRNLPPTVEFVGLPPGGAANETLTLVARAADADGPAPRIEWSVADARGHGTTFGVALPAGHHRVVARAVDADGEARETAATLVIAAPTPVEAQDPAPRAVPPRFRHASVEAAPYGLRVRVDVEPASSATTLVWAHGEIRVEDGDIVPWPAGAREVSGALVARHDGLGAEAPWGPLRLETPPMAPLAFEQDDVDTLAGAPLVLSLRPHEAPEYRFDLGDGWTSWGPVAAANVSWDAPGVREVLAQARDGERTVEARAVVRVLARVAAGDPSSAVEPAAVAEEAAEPAEAAVTEARAAPRQVPGAPMAALLGLALAARLGTRARSGRR